MTTKQIIQHPSVPSLEKLVLGAIAAFAVAHGIDVHEHIAKLQDFLTTDEGRGLATVVVVVFSAIRSGLKPPVAVPAAGNEEPYLLTERANAMKAYLEAHVTFAGLPEGKINEARAYAGLPPLVAPATEPVATIAVAVSTQKELTELRDAVAALRAQMKPEDAMATIRAAADPLKQPVTYATQTSELTMTLNGKAEPIRPIFTYATAPTPDSLQPTPPSAAPAALDDDAVLKQTAVLLDEFAIWQQERAAKAAAAAQPATLQASAPVATAKL